METSRGQKNSFVDQCYFCRNEHLENLTTVSSRHSKRSFWEINFPEMSKNLDGLQVI